MPSNKLLEQRAEETANAALHQVQPPGKSPQPGSERKEPANEGRSNEIEPDAEQADAQLSPITSTSQQAVIEDTAQAVSHYFFGKGTPVDIGIHTINTLLRTNDFLQRHQRITGGLTSSLNGSFSVDMTREIFHIGRTNVDYLIRCNGNTCTVTYTLFVDDGFWDVDSIDEHTLGRLGLPWFQPDGPGPNLERLGGTPFAYNRTKRSFAFTNPGYTPPSGAGLPHDDAMPAHNLPKED
ncbi:MAG: hypothetical protein AAFV88_03945 [Planctomycetota bacterium]